MIPLRTDTHSDDWKSSNYDGAETPAEQWQADRDRALRLIANERVAIGLDKARSEQRNACDSDWVSDEEAEARVKSYRRHQKEAKRALAAVNAEPRPVQFAVFVCLTIVGVCCIIAAALYAYYSSRIH